MARKKINEATDQRHFIMVYSDFLESDLLDDPYQKLVYIYLKKYANSKGQCFPSVSKIAEESKIGRTKVKAVLADLEAKGVISKANRSRKNGARTSNLYTVYDYKEIWKVQPVEQNADAVADEVEEAKMIAMLRSRGYVIEKAKEPISAPTTAADIDPHIISLDGNNYNRKKKSSQEVIERYPLETVKKMYAYGIMIHDHAELADNIETVISVLYDLLNTAGPTIRISGEEKPTETVIAKLSRLTYDQVLYVIRKYRQQDHEIKNPRAYLITMLYGAKDQQDLEYTNLIMSN